MKLNNDCMKAVLNYIVDHSGFDFDGSRIHQKKINSCEMVEFLQKDNHFDKETIVYAIVYAYKHKYIEVISMPQLDNFMISSFTIVDVTPLGYNYMNGL